MPLVVHPSSRCDVCLDPYSTSSDLATSPHTIECGHIFCFGCLHSLNTNTCPLCREPFDLDGVKRLHIGNPLEQDNAERDNAEQGVVPNRADFLLRRISLVSGEGVPEVDADEVVSEVQEWLQSQPGDPNSVSLFSFCRRITNAMYTYACCQYLTQFSSNFSYAAFLAYTTSSRLRLPPAI
ncbi:uncharacterized protein F5891DRAFT_960772 [Suillus fuscotomentosus]|uniref:RING-type domain-containing protein n=1 Tax=Suillus fuscotomentosus TaxID=1912939 RepID=A0AAD4HG32_9AGAM|nr:uncharacterized protein F5891DRAFT_960772 [Suillus fuscotomentosus]KAG1894911.1 hypothetical protein F5891DRAFT_960772 [Suillus fuscotomentosus]